MRLQDLPIKRKIIFVTLVTCGSVLAIASAALFLFQSIYVRKNFVSELQSMAAILAHNSAAPLLFQDNRSGVEVLSALNVKPQITSAFIVDAKGEVFASYGATRSVAGKPPVETESKFEKGYTHVAQPIVFKGSEMGMLHIHANFAETTRSLMWVYALVLTGILIGSLGLILLFSARLQSIVSKPLLVLADVARRIVEREDYQVRAPEGGHDEFGLLTRSFNNMLDQIQARDSSLRQLNRSLAAEISERKLAEAALKESRERYEVAVLGSSDGIWDWNILTNEIYLSPQWKKMIGFEDADLPNSFDVFRNRLHPEDRDRTLAALQDYLTGKTLNYEVEFRLQHKNGLYVWILARGAALHDRRGNPYRMAGSHTDISRRKQAEASLQRLNRELVEASRRAGMAEVASGVLHNVGNVLNSINVSATWIKERLSRSKSANLGKLAALLRQHSSDLPSYLSSDPQGQKLPGYLEGLSELLRDEHLSLRKELDALQKNVDHVKDVVAMQQDHAAMSGVTEMVPLGTVVEDALCMNAELLQRNHIQVIRDFAPIPPMPLVKQKILQILVNLIRNAAQSMIESMNPEKQLHLRITQPGENYVQVEVRDTGMGVSAENLTKIFRHGFTTKRDGHGFGLHSSGNAAKELGGSLTVHSDGPSLGATFILKLPVIRMTFVEPDTERPVSETDTKAVAFFK